MKIIFLTSLIFLFPIALVAQLVTHVAPLKVGNSWTYRGASFGSPDPDESVRYTVIDSLTEINGKKYFRVELNYKPLPYKITNQSILDETGQLYTVTKDSFYAYYYPNSYEYPDSLFRYFKTNIKYGDSWGQIINGDVYYISTVIDTFTANVFGTNVIVFHIGKKDTNNFIQSSELWTKEFGMIRGSFEEFMDYLWGCVIDGVVYGDTTFTSVENKNNLPAEIYLLQNYPNPFNPVTNIEYYLPDYSFVKLIIYNSIGEKVSEIVNENQVNGKHKVVFDAGKLSSGLYFYTLITDKNRITRKMILIK
ncbi:MAG: T9SS type A sorting domain-containing protein [Ignavibacteriales bacterium]|nr:T9SS type A sorting domain-containing protein [Ignavibacteriales bacterium]